MSLRIALAWPANKRRTQNYLLFMTGISPVRQLHPYNKEMYRHLSTGQSSTRLSSAKHRLEDRRYEDPRRRLIKKVILSYF